MGHVLATIVSGPHIPPASLADAVFEPLTSFTRPLTGETSASLMRHIAASLSRRRFCSASLTYRRAKAGGSDLRVHLSKQATDLPLIDRTFTVSEEGPY